jgi:hypothetical protein
MRSMAQPVDRAAAGKGLLSQEAVNAIWEQQQQQAKQAGLGGGSRPMEVG